eukprot:COSAG05_NODE_269_length_12494_cov_9.329326_4_plen_345_part_00
MPSSSVHRQHADALGAVAHSTVHVPSLAAPLRLMHITDSHCDLGPDAESGSEELCRYLHGRYVDGFKANEQRGPQTVHGHAPVPPTEAFEAQLLEAKRRGVDLVVHTGDLLNFPSPKAAEWAAETMERHGLPFLFIGGNHDWQHCNPGWPHTLEGPEMGSDALRAEWRGRALPALFDGGRRNSSHFSEIVGGCQFIGIDNSTRYITPDQLDFFLSATAVGDHPVVLMMHIPLRLPGLMEDGRADGGGKTGDARLKDTSVMDGQPDAEEEQQWREIGAPGALEATREFVAAVADLPSLVAVLTGHIHDNNADAIGEHGAVHYTTDAGCYSGSRFLEFLPGEAARL